MDFEDTPAEAAFRQQVRTWLADNASRYRSSHAGGQSVDEFIAGARAWQRAKAEAGYAAIRWPREQGGLDGTPMQEVIFSDEEARFQVPVGPFTGIGTGMAVPTLRRHASPELVEQFARPTLYGELLWCQLFSEPAAGSDLAGLRTRAVRDGDDWIITGQKVWNSWAHVADWGLLIARTDADVPKHKGLTYFVIDMKTPGVEVRPIRQISGDSEFNEVFLTEVRIPDRWRVGAVGEGWKVAMTTLMNERFGSASEGSAMPTVPDLLQLAEEMQASRPAAVAAATLRLAQLHAQEQGLKYYRFRTLTQLSKGETPSPLVAMGKLVYANVLQDLCSLAIDLQGAAGVTPAPGDERAQRFQQGYLWGAAMRIAGGTDEILRNQIAERVLGLPGDIRVDKDVPFSRLPAGR